MGWGKGGVSRSFISIFSHIPRAFSWWVAAFRPSWGNGCLHNLIAGSVISATSESSKLKISDIIDPSLLPVQHCSGLYESLERNVLPTMAYVYADTICWWSINPHPFPQSAIDFIMYIVCSRSCLKWNTISPDSRHVPLFWYKRHRKTLFMCCTSTQFIRVFLKMKLAFPVVSIFPHTYRTWWQHSALFVIDAALSLHIKQPFPLLSKRG